MKRATLEEVKLGAKPFGAHEPVLIYSREHRQYWRANGAGYTPNQRDAGRYTFGDAWSRTYHCGPEKGIEYEEAQRSLSSLEAALDLIRTEIRGRGAVPLDEAKSKRIELNHRHEWPGLWAALDLALEVADREIPAVAPPET